MTEESVVPVATEKSKKLVARFAERYGVEPNRLLSTLKATAFRQRDNRPITDEQMQALLIVAEQHGLNPWTKEIYAFADKDAIIPIVSVDGWARIINEHKAMDGVEFSYASAITVHPGNEHKPCPAWIECSITRKDRSRPIVVREYLDEVYQPPRGQNRYAGPWQSHTKRMLRHKAWIQCARLAFGFAGIYDEDEAERIEQAEQLRVVERPPVIEDPAPAIEAKKVEEVVLDLRTGSDTRGAAVKVTSGRSTTPYAEAAKPKGPPPLDDPEDADFTDAPNEAYAQALLDIQSAVDIFELSSVLDQWAGPREEWSANERAEFDTAFNERSRELDGGQ